MSNRNDNSEDTDGVDREKLARDRELVTAKFFDKLKSVLGRDRKSVV